MFKTGIWKIGDKELLFIVVWLKSGLSWVCSQWARGLSSCGGTGVVFHSQAFLFSRSVDLPSHPCKWLSNTQSHISSIFWKGENSSVNVLNASAIRNGVTEEAEEQEWAQKNRRRKKYPLLSCSLAVEFIISCIWLSLAVPLPNAFCSVVL